MKKPSYINTPHFKEKFGGPGGEPPEKILDDFKGGNQFFRVRKKKHINNFPPFKHQFWFLKEGFFNKRNKVLPNPYRYPYKFKPI